MQVFEKIAGQVDAVRRPLFAVTLSALPRADTPALLMLHWHGLPVSALQINERWRELESLDRGMLDAAWRFGAWQLERDERRGCATPGASEQEAHECRQAFGELPGGAAALLAEAPDRRQMLSLAAGIGYVRWQFRPVRGGLWRDAAEDDTLAADGSRPPPCPVPVRAAVGTRVSRTRYSLGRLARLVLP